MARAGVGAGRARTGARDAVFGSERRIGLWIVPLFLVTGLVGAVLAGGLAVLYYAQQVADLEAETASARAQLEQAVAEVTTAAEEARAAIDERARAAEERLTQRPPLDAPNDAGIYGVSAAHANGEVRVGSAFTLYSDSQQTWLATTYRLVATRDGFAVPSVEVFVPGQTVTGSVHNFDRDLDLAVIVVSGGTLPVLEWRPADTPIARGDPLYLAGIAGPGTGTIVEGTVGAANDQVIVPILPINAFLAGGPLLDASGQVLGVASLGYAPFGEVPGDLTYGVPVRALCRGLLRCTAEDLGLGDQGGTGALPAPPSSAGEAEPGPTASPSTAPTPAPTRPSPTATEPTAPEPDGSPTDAPT